MPTCPRSHHAAWRVALRLPNPDELGAQSTRREQAWLRSGFHFPDPSSHGALLRRSLVIWLTNWGGSWLQKQHEAGSWLIVCAGFASMRFNALKKTTKTTAVLKGTTPY
jgi:hypothetical protein